MSASCHRNKATVATTGMTPAARGSTAHGFTLLEILVVLALVGLLTAMVAPSLQNTYEAITSSGERAEVRRQLERLPLLARAAGTAIRIPPDATGALAERLQLPEGWTVAPLDPVRVEASGVCHRARVSLRGRGTVEQVLVTAPACQVTDAP